MKKSPPCLDDATTMSNEKEDLARLLITSLANVVLETEADLDKGMPVEVVARLLAELGVGIIEGHNLAGDLVNVIVVFVATDDIVVQLNFSEESAPLSGLTMSTPDFFHQITMQLPNWKSTLWELLA